ncbi:universal stress protein A-like protein [Actinidia eriantha]|uniref:universal stress protein A-like protein n=1 Tax=Actinidia eriantha TaxID=165200 RepID=UPI00258C2A9D|nr:universal stress protein A-like protein [Actinidia eriantha]
MKMDEENGMGMKVMVVIDESESSYRALMWTLQNIGEIINGSGNPLLIFMPLSSPTNTHVFPASLGFTRIYCPVPANPGNVNPAQEQNMVVYMGILEKAKSICSKHGINTETIAQIGDPKRAICDAVQKHNIKLLVLGDHEIGKIQRALVGSVSDYCVQNARCPVLVVKKPE